MKNVQAIIRTILLIDDDSDEHKLFCDGLYTFNSSISCLTAFNCPEGYTIAQIKKPDLIFLDMNLPGTNGIACLRKFKKTVSLKHVPIYMYSCGKVTDQEKELAMESGAAAWIKKPNSLDDYKGMFSKHLLA